MYYTYESNPFWDGRGCPAGDDCSLSLYTENRVVEVRICRDEVYSNEATLLEQVAMYIKSLKCENLQIACIIIKPEPIMLLILPIVLYRISHNFHPLFFNLIIPMLSESPIIPQI